MSEQEQKVAVKEEKLFSVRFIVFIGVFAAFTAVLAQVAIPTPWGIPITLQTFAVALTGYVLGKIRGPISVLVYILAGAIGAPVFAGFAGGLGKIVGVTGGYIWGFLFMAFACGLIDVVEKKWVSILLGIMGLLICHLCGSLQFAFVSNRTLVEALMIASVPYLIKDILSVVVAFGMAVPLRKMLNSQQ